MVKINGVKASGIDENSMHEIKPSINQILERMDSNYRDIQSRAQSMQNQNFGTSIFQGFQSSNQNSEKVSTLNTDANTSLSTLGDGNLLLTLLPALLSGKDKKNILAFDNPIFKEILKKSNNPMLQKILEILPMISKNKTSKQSEKKDDVKQETKIDSYVKTDDYGGT